MQFVDSTLGDCTVTPLETMQEINHTVMTVNTRNIQVNLYNKQTRADVPKRDKQRFRNRGVQCLPQSPDLIRFYHVYSRGGISEAKAAPPSLPASFGFRAGLRMGGEFRPLLKRAGNHCISPPQPQCGPARFARCRGGSGWGWGWVEGEQEG